MISSLSTGSGIAAYVNSLLDKAGKGKDEAGGAQATGGAASLQAAAKASLQTAAQGFKSATAQRALEQRQTSLASELNAGLAKAGVKLEGALEFSVGSDGGLRIEGSEKDRAAAAALLKNDTSKPGLSSRLVALAQDADALSGTLRQSAAISQAARYAGSAGGVMSLYTTLMKQQDTTAAVFSLSDAGGSLSYPGVLASKA